VSPSTITAGSTTPGTPPAESSANGNSSRIEAQQAKVKDVKTGKQLGRAHEHFDEIVDFVRHEMTSERYAVVHGDFKFDNVVSTLPGFNFLLTLAFSKRVICISTGHSPIAQRR
jgi:Cft2 family RNA processing exonuclease